MTSSDKPFLASKKTKLVCLGVGAVVLIVGVALVFPPSDSGWQAIGSAFMAIGAMVSFGAGGQAGVDMIAARNGGAGSRAD